MTAVSVPDQPAATGPGLLARTPVVALRVLQFALDLAIVAVLTLVPMSVLLILPRNPDDTLGALLVSIPVILGVLVAAALVSWWYWARLPRRRHGRTVAMGWLGLRTVRVDGGTASTSQLTLRWLLLLVDAMLLGLVGLVAMVATPRHQRIGDLMAETLVVRDRAGGSPPT
jgi:uncharacterized RDD family membrane protein YckC